MVLRVPGVGWLLGTSLLARLPVAMANLAIILRIATATGSYARAGAVTGAAVGGPRPAVLHRTDGGQRELDDSVRCLVRQIG